MTKKLLNAGRIEQVEMPEATNELLREILAQNRMILEANCMTMRLLGQPLMFIAAEDHADKT